MAPAIAVACDRADRTDSLAEAAFADSVTRPDDRHPSYFPCSVVVALDLAPGLAHVHPIVGPGDHLWRRLAGRLAGVHPEAVAHPLGSASRWLADLSAMLNAPEYGRCLDRAPQLSYTRQVHHLSGYCRIHTSVACQQRYLMSEGQAANLPVCPNRTRPQRCSGSVESHGSTHQAHLYIG